MTASLLLVRRLGAAFLLTLPFGALAQGPGVGIGTTTPNASAALDVSSTTKGLLPPRMSQAQRDAIASPAAGLTIYNTTTGKLNTWNGTSWDAALSATEQPQTFAGAGATFGTPGQYTYTVPVGVTRLAVEAAGAGGSNSQGNANRGGTGARVQATLAVTPGEVLTLYVGGSSGGLAGGYNGGGNGSLDVAAGGGGGGASDVRRGPATLADRVLVAAGGGGAGYGFDGAAGGAPTGGSTNNYGAGSGSGATQTAGGSAGGNLGQGGAASAQGGGGGGGYYGGGGGNVADGGGGGSSWVTPTGSSAINLTVGVTPANGNGRIVLSPLPTYAAPALDGSNFVNLPPAPSDNLGNHTATQNLNLADKLLVGNGGTSGLAISSGGNVGIGASSPGSRLYVRAANNSSSTTIASFMTQDGTQGVSVTPQGITTTGTYASNLTLDGSYFGNVLLNTNSSNGKVGIGVFSPSQKLEVAGQVYSTSGGFRFPDNTVQTTAATDAQQLSISGSTISLTGGGSVTVPAAPGDNLGNHLATQNLSLGANQLVGNGGSSGLAVGSTGSVGIGTTSPSQKLEVVGNVKVSGTGNGLTFPDGTTQTTAATGGSAVTASNGLTKTGSDIALGGTLTQPTTTISGITGTNTLELTGTAAPLITNTTAAASASARVLGLRGSYSNAIAGSGAHLSFLEGGGSEVGRIASTQDAGSFLVGLSFSTTNGSAASLAERLRISPAGNVGIGTSTPAAKLTVQPATEAELGLRVTDGANGNIVLQTLPGGNSGFSFMGFNGANNSGEVRYNTSKNRWRLGVDQRGSADAFFLEAYDGTTGVNVLRATTSGNVGIGTASPNSRLSISPGTVEPKITLWDGGSTTAHYGFGVSNGQLNYHVDGTSSNHVFYAGGKNGTGAELLRMQGNGNVGIGVAPAVRLHVAGTAGTANVRLESLAGPGIRMVTADAIGNLSTAATPADAQTLTIAGSTLSISNGNSVTLPSGGGTADNLGNHTATQALNLGANQLVGTGSSISGVGVGITAQGGLNMGQNATGNGIFIGFQSGINNTPNTGTNPQQGTLNQFVGYQAGPYNTSGRQNVFTGAQSGFNNTTGSTNTFNGLQSGFNNTTGSNNTFSGGQSGLNNDAGNNNVFTGVQSGLNTSAGSSNAFYGTLSGQYNGTGNRNTALGTSSGPASGSTNLSNTTAIGADAVVTASNSVVLGNNANVGIGTSAPATRLDVNGNLRLAVRNLSSGPPPAATLYLNSDDLRYSIYQTRPGLGNYVAGLRLPDAATGLQVPGQQFTIINSATESTLTIDGTNTDNTATVVLAAAGTPGTHGVMYVWSGTAWVRVQ